MAKKGKNHKKTSKKIDSHSKTKQDNLKVSIVLYSSLIAAIIGVFAYFWFSSSSVPEGIGQHFPSQGHEHNMELTKTFAYNSVPPTSGPHDEVYPAYIINDQQMDKAALVHLLEHGNIVITYNQLNDNKLNQLKQWVTQKNNEKQIPTKNFEEAAEKGEIIFLTPWSEVPIDTIRIAAWTRLLELKNVEPTELGEFVKQWQMNEKNFNQ